jgi:lysozyme family protein
MTPLVGLLVRGALVSIFFLLLIYYSKASEDFNNFLHNGLNTAKKWINKSGN